MRFLLVCAATETARIEGISAAGATRTLMAHTPAADAELLAYGQPALAPVVPVSPDGCPTPAIVTRAVREWTDFPLLVCDAGLAAPTGAPTVSLGNRPGGDIRDPEPVSNAHAVYECGVELGRSLTDDHLVVGESIPGGTTTALGVLTALGEPHSTSSSLPENPQSLKERVVEAGLRASDLEPGDCAGDPIRAVERMGDPMLAAVAGLAVGALDRGRGSRSPAAPSRLRRRRWFDTPVSTRRSNSRPPRSWPQTPPQTWSGRRPRSTSTAPSPTLDSQRATTSPSTTTGRASRRRVLAWAGRSRWLQNGAFRWPTSATESSRATTDWWVRMDPEAVRATGRVPHGSSDDPDVLDFSANTNPLVPSGVREVYAAALERARTYPQEPPAECREAAAAYVGCDASQVVPTPGGLAAIRLAIECTVSPGDSVLVPYPSFGEYAREVRLQGATVSHVPHDELLAADPMGHALAVCCTPNNPTGEAVDPACLREFAVRCRDAGTPLLVDEAFLGFTDHPSLAGEPGVVVARSLTKLFGLPGIRAGFAVAEGDLLDSLLAARRSWNMGTPALDVGAFCMRQTAFVAETRVRVASERDRMASALGEKFTVHPSDAPYLLLDVGDRDVTDLLEHALSHGIAIRDATTFRGLDSHVRVAVRLPDENDELLEVLDV